MESSVEADKELMEIFTVKEKASVFELTTFFVVGRTFQTCVEKSIRFIYLNKKPASFSHDLDDGQGCRVEVDDI